MSPLRYDILIREQFFDFLEDHLEVYETDFDRFMDLALDLPYFTWFRSVAYPRFHRFRGAGDLGLRLAYEDRVRRSYDLLREYRTAGFDSRFPVSVRIAHVPERTASGKTLKRRYYLADGCHRLALMRREGRTILATDCYRIRHDYAWVPRDNTYGLIGLVELGRADYYRFLSIGYADREIDNREDLLRYVAEHTPERSSELQRVLDIDEPLLAP